MHIFPQEGFAAARLRRATLLLSAALLSFSGPAQAQLLWDADGVPGGSIGGTGNWNTTDAFWDNSGTMTTWDNAANSVAQFGGTAGTVTVTTGITVNRLVFDVSGYLVTGNALTLAGTTPTITTDADATVASNLSGATLRKNGSGALTTTGDITLTGGWDLDSGTTNIQGAANVTAGTNAPLRIGEAAGSRAVLKINTTGTVSLGASVASAYAAVGGNGSGAVYHDAGRMEIGTTNSFSYLGVGRGTNSYGYYRMVGGELIEGPGGGRLGANIADGTGSIGVLDQMGGTLTFNRYIVINNAGGSSFGQMTLTGGTLNQTLAGNLFLVGDDGSGRLNLGTLAGGNALISSQSRLKLGEAGVTSSGYLNLNSGTLRFMAANAGINADTDGRDTPGRELTASLNGATLQSGLDNITLIWGGGDAPLQTVLYRGGLTVDTQSFNATIAAGISGATGNGFYRSTTFTATPTGAAGAGYIGPPIVAVSGGSGSGAQVNALVDTDAGTITGFVVTNPGQGYQAGDTLTFTLSGNAGSTLAAPYSYTLQPADLAANGTGIFRKEGSGILTLSAANTFTGETRVAAGTLRLSAAGSLLSSLITIDSGATFDASLVSGFALLPGQALGGRGTFSGSVLLNDGAGLMFDAAGPFTIAGGTMSFGAGFGIADIIGLDATVSQGTYTLVAGSVDLTGLANVGFENRAGIGGGKEAYFEEGSLQLVVVPEPGTVALGALGLLLGGRAVARRRGRRCHA